MKTIPRQVVIDKNVFQRTNTNELRAFAKNHFLIFPEVLLYECLTATKAKNTLLDRFRRGMLAGAYICPPIRAIVYKEARTLSPYGFLADLQMTSQMRNSLRKNPISFNDDYVEKVYHRHLESAGILVDSARQIAEKIASEQPQTLTAAKRYQARSHKRLELWVEEVKCKDIHKLAVRKLYSLTSSLHKYCLSPDWVTWHYFCLVCIIHLDYAFLKTVGGGDAKLTQSERDCQDIEYVAYLSRVDGLLTKDERLVEPLARAWFPDKSVFSSLNEVPDEYICHSS